MTPAVLRAASARWMTVQEAGSVVENYAIDYAVFQNGSGLIGQLENRICAHPAAAGKIQHGSSRGDVRRELERSAGGDGHALYRRGIGMRQAQWRP